MNLLKAVLCDNRVLLNDIDCLVQDCGISSVSAVEIPHFWTDMILHVGFESQHYFTQKMPSHSRYYQVFF